MAIMMLSGKPPGIHVDVSLTGNIIPEPPWQPGTHGPLTQLDYAHQQTMNIMNVSHFELTSKPRDPSPIRQSRGTSERKMMGFF